MSPLDFLAAVLPSSGRYCAFETTRKRHTFVDSIEALLETALKMNAEVGINTYFWMAATSNADAKTRTAEDARCVRSLWMDVDVGKDEKKTYASKQDAAEAIDAFLSRTGMDALGQPFMTTSGNGFQVFWPLVDDTPIASWRPVSENFKLLCHQEGLLIDTTCTADAARVMRMPGTINYGKDGSLRKKAKVLMDADTRFTIEQLDEFIKSKLKVKTFEEKRQVAEVISLPGSRPTSSSPSAVKLFENMDTYFKDILDRTKEGVGCGQLEYYVENATSDGMEPLWRGLLSIAQKCADGGKACTWLSKLHPYDVDRMAQKLREIRGPYPCLKLDSENPGICDKCRHFGKITNPLALGRKLATDNEAKEIEVAFAAEDEDVVPKQVVVNRPAPPRGFSYGKNGAVFKDAKTQDADGNEVNAPIMLVPYSMFVVDILNHGKEHTIHMLALRPEGAAEIELTLRSIASKDETIKSLAEQNILASYGHGNDKNLYEYIRACAEEASVSKRATKVPVHYGWQDDDSFVFNERIYSSGKQPQHIPMRGLINVNKNTRPCGDVSQWRKVIELLNAKKMYELLTVCLVGFGSPLMRFTGFDGITFHLGSTESGTGKSLALELAASVWGHPTKYRVGKGTSDVAMQQRMGLLHSLPLISDEITMKNRNNPEWIPGFIFDVSEGQGKERMEAGANKERENTTYWSDIALLSSNTHIMDYLSGARTHSSEGEMRRLLEKKLSKVIEWAVGDTDIIKLIKHNYGRAGEIYAQYLVDNLDTVKKVLREVHDKLKKDFNFTDDERYWHAGCSALVAGGILVGKAYANIVDFPLQGVIGVLREVIVDSRAVIKANVRTAEDVLNSYIREFYGKFVVIKALDGALAASIGGDGIIDESVTRSEILGRVEHGITPGHVDFYIEEQLIKRYCSSMSFGYSDFCKQMENAYHVNYLKKDLMSKTKGPQMRVNAMRISRKIDEEPETEIALPLAAA